MSGNLTGQGRRAKTKWQLLKAVEDSRDPLGMKGTTLAVLRAALSFIRSDDICDTRPDAHICFASNAKLAERAHVSVQTVERHLSKLVASGLIERVSSGNGKRWARRDSLGRIVFATGLSVLPLLRRHEEFLEIAQRHQEQVLELTLLRDECALKMAELTDQVEETAEIILLKSKARNILRRKPNSDALNGLLSEIIDELSKISCQNPKDLRDKNHHNEGHKETLMNPSVSKKKNEVVHVSQQDMERYFPKLCLELRLAPSQTACQRLMDDLSQHLGLGGLWSEIKELGPALSFMVLGYILERIDTIHRPRAYAWRLLADLNAQHIDWRHFLRRPQNGLSMFNTTLGIQGAENQPQATSARV